jgi:hypothetical protein
LELGLAERVEAGRAARASFPKSRRFIRALFHREGESVVGELLGGI